MVFCGFNKQFGRKLSLTFRDYRKSTTWFNKAGIYWLNSNVDPKRLFEFLAIVANQLKMCSESTHIFANGLAGELLCSETIAGTWCPGTESWWNRTVHLLRILFKKKKPKKIYLCFHKIKCPFYKTFQHIISCCGSVHSFRLVVVRMWTSPNAP